MNETHAAAAFTRLTMMAYIQLYAAFAKAKDDNVEFVNNPQFDKEDWIGFETGTIEYLASIQGKNGVPLFCLLRDNRLCPALTVAFLRKLKIFWKALLIGTDFNLDNKRVWTYMAQCCINTPGWSHIKSFLTTSNG